MIPNFDRNGNLPPGQYLATLEEFEEKFVYGMKRKDLFEGIKRLIDDLRKIGCKTLFIDGSYTTQKLFPSDFDACWDDTGVDHVKAKAIVPELYNRGLRKLRYKGDVFQAYVLATPVKLYIDFFQSDKDDNPKGIIKINL